MPHHPPLKADVVARLRQAEVGIRALGVSRIRVFGSVAREEATSSSDIDLLVDFFPGRKDIDAFFALVDLLEDLFDQPVDIVTPEGLSRWIGPTILAEAEDVLHAA